MRTHVRRAFFYTLTVVSFPFWGTVPVRAAGCHVVDRPVLQSALSWDQDRAQATRESTGRLTPPVLAHRPCPGETPHAPGSSAIAVQFALIPRVGVDPPLQCTPIDLP